MRGRRVSVRTLTFRPSSHGECRLTTTAPTSHRPDRSHRQPLRIHTEALRNDPVLEFYARRSALHLAHRKAARTFTRQVKPMAIAVRHQQHEIALPSVDDVGELRIERDVGCTIDQRALSKILDCRFGFKWNVFGDTVRALLADEAAEPALADTGEQPADSKCADIRHAGRFVEVGVVHAEYIEIRVHSAPDKRKRRMRRVAADVFYEVRIAVGSCRQVAGARHAEDGMRQHVRCADRITAVDVALNPQLVVSIAAALEKVHRYACGRICIDAVAGCGTAKDSNVRGAAVTQYARPLTRTSRRVAPREAESAGCPGLTVRAGRVAREPLHR